MTAREILDRWPSRRAVLVDAQAAEPGLQFVAVHRWFQRQSVPARFWPALIEGARLRGFAVTLDELAAAHRRPGRQAAHAAE